MSGQKLDLTKISTELRNKKTMELDSLKTEEIVKIMNSEDNEVVKAIKCEINNISNAIELVVKSFNKGGRLIYIGAGTSGRLGVLDAVECVPTFGVPDTMVVGLIAGGDSAFVKAVEGAEDNKDLAISDLRDINLCRDDIVVGIAASGRTPYVIGGLEYANNIGCNTVSVSCNKNSEISKLSKVAIEAQVGPEVLTGSTRLKAGTAQKMILNMLSTGSMIKIGKTYENFMIDLKANNEKLKDRAIRIVAQITGVQCSEALAALLKCDWEIKTAIVTIIMKLDAEEARLELRKHGGVLRKLIKTKLAV